MKIFFHQTGGQTDTMKPIEPVSTSCVRMGWVNMITDKYLCHLMFTCHPIPIDIYGGSQSVINWNKFYTYTSQWGGVNESHKPFSQYCRGNYHWIQFPHLNEPTHGGMKILVNNLNITNRISNKYNKFIVFLNVAFPDWISNWYPTL